MKACNVIKKETPTQVFFCKYCEIFKMAVSFNYACFKDTLKVVDNFKNKQQKCIAAFHTKRPGNYSICLSGQKFLGTIFQLQLNNMLVKKIN